MHLSVDTASTLLDLEGTTITPGLVPGVDAKPVFEAGIFIGSPTDDLDGVTTEGSNSGIWLDVDTRLVGEEVLIDGEGSSDSTVSLDILLDVANSTETIAGAGRVLVISVNSGLIIRASLGALRLNLSDSITRRKGITGNVMGTSLHGVVEAGISGTVSTSSNNTSVLEPSPWGTNLTTVATH